MGDLQIAKSACCAGQHVSQVVSQAGGGPSTWGALTWLAPPAPAVLPPYLHNFAQVGIHHSSIALHHLHLSRPKPASPKSLKGYCM